MARRVRNDEAALGRRKEPVGHIDSNALLPFGLETVHQQCEVEIFALSAVLAGIRFKRLHLVVKDVLGLVEQAADQCGLAVVHAAAGDEPECGPLVHQKYPSCFFFSIEPGWSESMSLPWRSETRARKVSAMISSSELAVLSMAPVSG